MTHDALVKLVRRELKAAGLTPADLHRELQGRATKQTVYNFVKHGRVIKTDTLFLVLNRLGLTIRKKRR
jgi:hypothetical protein